MALRPVSQVIGSADRGERAIVELLVLILLANAAPILAGRLMGDTASWALDGGRRWRDGTPLLGHSKTWRGVAAAVVLTALAAALLGRGAAVGAGIGAAAMLGDAASSFVKRRLGRPPSAMAPGLDQLPEALVPAALLAPAFDLGPVGVLAVCGMFLVLELALSRIAFALGIRDRPY